MKQTGWNRRDFLKTGIQIAGVAEVGSSVNLLAEAEPSGDRLHIEESSLTDRRVDQIRERELVSRCVSARRHRRGHDLS